MVDTKYEKWIHETEEEQARNAKRFYDKMEKIRSVSV
jgi:hypothetical protein